MFVALLAGAPGLWAVAGDDPDQAALMKARKAGVDLSQPRKILFTLMLPAHVTEQTTSHLAQQGFSARVWITNGYHGILFATKTMVPELGALQSIRGDINSLLSSVLTEFERSWGSYEGWEILDLSQGGEDDPDEIALLKARNAGINLARPHEIQFHLVFPWTPHDVALSALEKAGFTTIPSVVFRDDHSGEGHETFVLATRTMVPELGALQMVRRDLNSLIASLPDEYKKGRYYGWVISNSKPLNYLEATGLWGQAGRILLFTKRAYSCDFENPASDPVQMFVSTDGGHTWKKGGPGLSGYEYMFLSQRDGKVWIVGEHTAEGPDTDPFVFVPSTGDNWQMRNIYQGNAAVDRMAWGSKGELFAWIQYARLSDLTYGSAYIYQSLDGGRTWKLLGLASRLKVEIAEEFKKISTHMDPLWRAVDLKRGSVVQHRESEAAPWKTVWRSPTPACQY